MEQALDGFTRPPAAAIAQAGYKGALCYLYNVTRAEIDACHAAGVSVGFIGEHDTKTHHPVLDGAAAGKANGAQDFATLQRLGVPTGQGIVSYATADTDVPAVHPDDFPIAAAYLDAYAAELKGYRVGIYGGEDLCDFAITNHHATHGWGASATSWNHGHVSKLICLRQRYPGGTVAGVGVDFDDILQDDWGQWAPNGESWMANPTQAEVDAFWKLSGVPDDSIHKPIDYIAGRVRAFLNAPEVAPGSPNPGVQVAQSDIVAGVKAALADLPPGTPGAPVTLKVTLEGTATPST